MIPGKVKRLNWVLLSIALVILLEMILNLLGRKALLDNNFGKAESFLSWIRNKELLGLVYYKQDQFEEAFDFYNRLKDWNGMGWAYFGMGKYEEAQDYFNRAKSVSGLGQVKLAEGKYKEAREIFETIEDNSGLGLTYLVYKDFESAQKEFIKSGDMLGFGLCLLAKGNIESAIETLGGLENNAIQGVIALVKGEYKTAIEIFEQLNYNRMLASTYEEVGRLDKALEVHQKGNNLDQVAYIQLELGKYNESYDIFFNHKLNSGLGNVFEALADYPKAFQYYVQNNAYEDALRVVLKSGLIEMGKTLIDELMNTNDLNPNLYVMLAEIFRQHENQSGFETMVEKLKNTNGYEARAYIMDSREKVKSLEESNRLSLFYQKGVDIEGQSFLTRDLLNSARMLGVPLTVPDSENVKVKIERNRYKAVWLSVVIVFGILIIYLMLWYFLYRKEMAPLMEDLKLSHGEVSKTHKRIYKDKTSLNLDTMQKLKSQVAPSVKDAEEVVKKFEEIRQKQTETPAVDPGLHILKMALEKLSIVTTVSELKELAVEESKKLTVYGIYLAARGKGVQVQGIKVNFSYLQENKDKVNLVFFHDESFALINEISDSGVSFNRVVEKIEEMPTDQFEKDWNGYVISLSKWNNT